jgi:hypothetical protein
MRLNFLAHDENIMFWGVTIGLLAGVALDQAINWTGWL